VLQQLFRGEDRSGHGAPGMTPGLRFGLAASALLHLAVLLFLLIGLPIAPPKDDEPQETAVAMVFQSDAKASVQAPIAAPSKDSPQPAPPVPAPPKLPASEAPPPPPPPPPPQVPQTHVEPAPPAPPPPLPTPPPEPAPAPNVVPTPPAPPTPPSPTPPKPQALPTPPLPMPQPPAPPSATSQPNATTNPAPNSNAIENTLEKLRQQMARATPARTPPNAQSGGQPNTGGKPLGNDTAALTADQRGAIGDHVRECWTKDAGALDIDKQRVLLTVTTDATGVARKAEIAGDDVGRLGDPRFRAFAERARRAIMDSRCAALPLPNNVLGKVNILTFRFSP
jgi:neural Wiskott-Aldrich syndrome protein